MEGLSLVDLSEDMLSLKETLCLDLLKIIDAISPGLNRTRAMILYELQAVVALRSRKLVIGKQINKDELKSHATVTIFLFH